jgi:hypothetical protein
MQVSILHAARSLFAAGVFGDLVEQVYAQMASKSVRPRAQERQRRSQQTCNILSQPEVVACTGEGRDAGETSELDCASAVDSHGDNYRTQELAHEQMSAALVGLRYSYKAGAQRSYRYRALTSQTSESHRRRAERGKPHESVQRSELYGLRCLGLI